MKEGDTTAISVKLHSIHIAPNDLLQIGINAEHERPVGIVYDRVKYAISKQMIQDTREDVLRYIRDDVLPYLCAISSDYI